MSDSNRFNPPAVEDVYVTLAATGYGAETGAFAGSAISTPPMPSRMTWMSTSTPGAPSRGAAFYEQSPIPLPIAHLSGQKGNAFPAVSSRRNPIPLGSPRPGDQTVRAPLVSVPVVNEMSDRPPQLLSSPSNPRQSSQQIPATGRPAFGNNIPSILRRPVVVHARPASPSAALGTSLSSSAAYPSPSTSPGRPYETTPRGIQHQRPIPAVTAAQSSTFTPSAVAKQTSSIDNIPALIAARSVSVTVPTATPSSQIASSPSQRIPVVVTLSDGGSPPDLVPSSRQPVTVATTRSPAPMVTPRVVETASPVKRRQSVRVSVGSSIGGKISSRTRQKESGVLAYTCSWADCDFQFEDIDSLGKHFRYVHLNSIQDSDISCKWAHCTELDRLCSDKAELSRHVRKSHLCHAAVLIPKNLISKNFVPVNPLKPARPSSPPVKKPVSSTGHALKDTARPTRPPPATAVAAAAGSSSLSSTMLSYIDASSSALPSWLQPLHGGRVPVNAKSAITYTHPSKINDDNADAGEIAGEITSPLKEEGRDEHDVNLAQLYRLPPLLVGSYGDTLPKLDETRPTETVVVTSPYQLEETGSGIGIALTSMEFEPDEYSDNDDDYAALESPVIDADTLRSESMDDSAGEKGGESPVAVGGGNDETRPKYSSGVAVEHSYCQIPGSTTHSAQPQRQGLSHHATEARAGSKDGKKKRGRPPTIVRGVEEAVVTTPLPEGVALVTLSQGVDVPGDCILVKKTTKRRCGECRFIRFVCQMQHRDAPVPVFTADGTVKLVCFCTLRCRVKFAARHMEVDFGSHPLLRVTVSKLISSGITAGKAQSVMDNFNKKYRARSETRLKQCETIEQKTGTDATSRKDQFKHVLEAFQPGKIYKRPNVPLSGPASADMPEAKRVYTPREVVSFNTGCYAGPYLDQEKVRRLPSKVLGTPVGSVVQKTLQHLIDAADDPHEVFTMLRAGHSRLHVTCTTASGERLIKHIRKVDRKELLWTVIHHMLKLLRCCRNFVTPLAEAGTCQSCWPKHDTPADKELGDQTPSGSATSLPFDSASVGITPTEQSYPPSLDVPPESMDTSVTSQADDGGSAVQHPTQQLKPVNPPYNPSRPTVIRSLSGHATLHGQSILTKQLDPFGNADIQHLKDKNPKTWTVEDVRAYMLSCGFPSQAELFAEQEIDGSAVLLLTADSLVRYMGMLLGPSLKLCNRVDVLKTMWNMN